MTNEFFQANFSEGPEVESRIVLAQTSGLRFHRLQHQATGTEEKSLFFANGPLDHWTLDQQTVTRAGEAVYKKNSRALLQ